MKNAALLLTTVFFSLNSLAALLTTEAGKSKVEGVSLSATATASIEGESVKLSHIGAGLRAKK